MVLAWAAGILLPVQATITVVGSNNPATDLPAVQAAVDGDPDVVLTGTFDFGTGTVTITNDVTIVGNGATIRNGDPAFTVDNPGGCLVVTGIVFDGPSLASVYCSSALASATFNDNSVDFTGSGPFYGVHILSESATIESNIIDIVNAAGGTTAIWLEQTGLTSGDSTISSNAVTIHNSDGIKCQYVENVLVTGNTVDTSGDNGFGGTLESILVRGSNSQVKRNQIHADPTPVAGTTLIGVALANGEGDYVGYNRGNGFLTEGIRLHAVCDSLVEHNKFSGPLGIGILAIFVNDRNIIKSNKLEGIIGVQYWLPVPYSYAMFLTGSDNVVSNNKFSGQADYGVVMADIPPYGLTAWNNNFRGNNLATMDAFTATYWCQLGTEGNTVKGYTGTVIDEGTDNSFTGK